MAKISDELREFVDTDVLDPILTHERPDSWERIADELEAAKGWRDQNGEYNCIVSSVSTKTLGDWADRIRRLAKKEG